MGYALKVGLRTMTLLSNKIITTDIASPTSGSGTRAQIKQLSPGHYEPQDVTTKAFKSRGIITSQQLMSWALVAGELYGSWFPPCGGPCGSGPCGSPWALVGRATVGPPEPLWARRLWAPLGPCGTGGPCGRAFPCLLGGI